jgi:hypothetical protein
MKINILFVLIVPLLLCGCKVNNNTVVNLKNTTYVSSFTKYEIYYYKLRGYKLVGGVSISFKEDGFFDFNFDCTKGSYHGRYEVKNDTICLFDSNLPLPDKFIVENEKKISGQEKTKDVTYMYKFIKQ